MSLLYIDGFDTYESTNNTAPAAGTLDSRYFINGSSVKVQEGRDAAGHCIEFQSSTLAYRKVVTTNATLVVGAAVYTSGFGFAAHTPLLMYTETALGMNVNLGFNGTIAVRRGSTTLNTSATGVMTANTWQYVELQVLCSNTGSYELWVDGVSILSDTGVDTQNHASKSYHDAIGLASGTGVTFTRLDDFYVCDGTGSTNNSNLGDVEVSVIRPDGDDTTDWTANGAGSHYVEVDEVELDNDTTFITTGTPGDQDIFTYGGLASNGAIKGVQVTTDLRETAADSYQLKTLAKSAGNTVNVTSAVGAMDYVANTELFEDDPDGAAWTQGTVNSTKFGVEAV
jgi:hypothetical protein